MCPGLAPGRAKKKTAAVPSTDEKNSKAVAMSTNSSSASLDIQQCSASALASHLLQERFAGKTEQTVAFLQQAIESIQQSAEPITAASSANSDKAPAVELGNPLLATPLETSLLNPRGGKCSIQLHDNGYLVATPLKTPSTQLIVPATAVSHMILFAKPEEYKILRDTTTSTKKKQLPNAHLVLLKLHESSGVTFQTKPVSQVCFALTWVKGTGPTSPRLVGQELDSSDNTAGWQEATMAWKGILETCLGGSHNQNLVVTHVQATTNTTNTNTTDIPFVSASSPDQSTTTGGMPFVKCYHGVQDGVLFPLREGLLFYKPPKFLPRQELVSIACGRGGGGGQSSSRYVDMVIQLQTDQTEFTNIQREELGVLNEYIHQVLIPAMQSDQATATKTSGKKNDGDDDDDATEDDEDEEAAVEEDNDDTDDEDENFVEGDDNDNEHDEQDGSDDSEDDEDDDEEEDDDFEVVDDDFAKELAKTKKNATFEEPRASRSRSNSKRKGSPVAQQEDELVEVAAAEADDDDDIIVANDDDFEVVQAASSTESEDDQSSESPGKKSRN